MADATVTSMSALFRDLYPQPGERLKQWVVDSRREADWERQTCPRVEVPDHEDNTGAGCRNVNAAPWLWLQSHDCCSYCGDLAEKTRARADVQAWLTERDARPPVERDRDKLSDEVQAAYPLPTGGWFT